MGEGPDSVVGASSRPAPRSSRGTTLWSRRSILTGLAAATMACTGQRGPGSTTTTIPRVAAGPEALAFTGVHEGSWSRGGDAVPATSYRPIVDHLADGLDIRMGHPVSVVRSEADGVRVVTDGGEIVGATVVVTVPLGVLQAGTIRFEPELPRAKVAAIDSLGMGVMDKVVLRFDEAFWDPDVDLVAYTADRSGYFVEWYNAVPWTGRPILVGFNAGRPAAEIESWSDDETLDAALDVLRRIRW